MRTLRLLAVTAIALSAGACRTVLVTSDPGPAPTYSISVRNETADAVIVSYNAGRGDAILGSVSPQRAERFIIAAPASPTVTVRATNEARNRSYGPFTVNLVAGSTVPVTIR
jgi:hypothetical protein